MTIDDLDAQLDAMEHELSLMTKSRDEWRVSCHEVEQEREALQQQLAALNNEHGVSLVEVEGRWVKWEDYAALRAENARLKGEIDTLDSIVADFRAKVTALERELAEAIASGDEWGKEALRLDKRVEELEAFITREEL